MIIAIFLLVVLAFGLVFEFVTTIKTEKEIEAIAKKASQQPMTFCPVMHRWN